MTKSPNDEPKKEWLKFRKEILARIQEIDDKTVWTPGVIPAWYREMFNVKWELTESQEALKI